jgi:hypothetical protein
VRSVGVEGGLATRLESRLKILRKSEANQLAAPGRTVRVNCSAGDSINAALKASSPDVPLTIQVYGMCKENVVIGRDNVVLLGRDPARDGIIGTWVSSNPLPATVAVRRASLVQIQNLNLTGDAGDGVLVQQSRSGYVVNCRLDNNPWYGAEVDDGELVLLDSALTGNGEGILGESGSWLYGSNLTISNSPMAINLNQGSLGYFSDSDLSATGLFANGWAAVAASHGSYIRIETSTVSSPDVAFVSSSAIRLDQVQFSGAVAVGGGSLVMHGSTNLGTFLTQSFATDNSHINVRNWNERPGAAPGDPSIPSTLKGPLNVGNFSGVLLTGGSVLEGDVWCTNEGGEAYCADPADVTGEVLNCRGTCAAE